MLEVVLAVDEAKWTTVGWSDQLLKQIEKASDVFDEAFGVRLKPVAAAGIRTPESATTPEHLLASLHQSFHVAENRVLIFFTGRLPPPSPSGKGRITFGVEAHYSNKIMLYDASEYHEYRQLQVLVHELGHLFGAVHVRSPESIMAPTLTRVTQLAFDDLNWKIVACNVDMEVHNTMEETLGAFQPDKLTQLHQYYSAIARRDAADAGASMTAAIMAFLLQDREKTDAALREALALEPGNPGVLYNAGKIYERLGEAQTAIALYKRAVEIDPKHTMARSSLKKLEAAPDRSNIPE